MNIYILGVFLYNVSLLNARIAKYSSKLWVVINEYFGSCIVNFALKVPKHKCIIRTLISNYTNKAFRWNENKNVIEIVSNPIVLWDFMSLKTPSFCISISLRNT